MSPYIDGRLSDVERDSVLFHTEICPECQGYLESMGDTVQLLRRLPTVFPSRSFTLAQAPQQRAQVFGAFSVDNWFRGLAAAVVPNTGWLRTATAVAMIFLLVLVAGDLTGALHSDDTSEISVGDSDGVIPEGTTAPAIANNASLEQDVPRNDGTPADASELEGPAVTGIASDQTETGAEEVDSPLTSSAPLPFVEATALPSSSALEIDSEESAYSWLRPVEVTMGALVLVLGGLLIVARKQKQSWLS